MSEIPSRDPSRDNAMSVAAISSERSSPTITPGPGGWCFSCASWRCSPSSRALSLGAGHRFIGGEEDAFENQPMAWQTATVYFAVIELVAAVGLWLATPWGAVVWLTTVVSMAVIELMFPASTAAACWSSVAKP